MKKPKLIFDFPVHKCLEIFSEKTNMWHRVTANDFRSYNGPRRIVMKYDDQNQPIHEKYEGPVYVFDTNQLLKNDNQKGFIYADDNDPRVFKLRPGEHRFIDDIKKEGNIVNKYK